MGGFRRDGLHPDPRGDRDGDTSHRPVRADTRESESPRDRGGALLVQRLGAESDGGRAVDVAVVGHGRRFLYRGVVRLDHGGGAVRESVGVGVRTVGGGEEVEVECSVAS